MGVQAAGALVPGIRRSTSAAKTTNPLMLVKPQVTNNTISIVSYTVYNPSCLIPPLSLWPYLNFLLLLMAVVQGISLHVVVCVLASGLC